MIDAATVVWLVEGDQQTAPSEDAARALEAWGKEHGVKLAPPTTEGAPVLPIDWTAGETVEQGIARARDALAALDFDAAERELTRAEAVLREHPELPQAAWLLAEVERAWSVRWLRSNADGASAPAAGRSKSENEARAKRAWQRAAGLDGGRAAGLGETAFEPGGTITATIRLAGHGGGTLRLDGKSIAPGEVKSSEGEHALAIVGPEPGAGATWAAWVSLAQGIEVKVETPEAPACSRDEMDRARLEHETIRAAGVRCGAWIAAVAEADGVIRVATCQGETCAPLVEWRSSAIMTIAPVVILSESRRWPKWATWALAGVGVAGAAVGVAAAAGAFKSSPPQQETQFVNGGLQVHSF
ncbi:MAG: hypothetical protein ACLQVI_42505 [Polyangiaceae bacterium]